MAHGMAFNRTMVEATLNFLFLIAIRRIKPTVVLAATMIMSTTVLASLLLGTLIRVHELSNERASYHGKRCHRAAAI